MPKPFEWEPDISRGEWLRPMEAEPLGSILSVVPRGFEAYARLFHPVERDRPRDTRTWHGVDQMTHFDDVVDIGAALETERATWAEVATAFGTTMHAEAQFARLARRDYGDVGGVIDAAGWRYGDTEEGRLDPTSLAVASAVLARHTSTPDAGIAAVWEGWGGLISAAGVAYLRFEAGDDAPAPDIRDPQPGSGLLRREVAAGSRFDLHGNTGRRYVLFEAGANDLADAAWPGRAPWVAEVMWAQSPSILWPDDHSWVLATEIDFDSTLIAGSTQLIRELVQTPGLEVLPIRTDADLTWDGDSLNRP
ncbi:hypothetical protein D9V29_12230 [Mycetocola manganoxydans]|uniref:Uncharacterized protein n=1 Tax=Mycetocola manganoxydans TaxID=699879 RepID=A0A3L6ZME1_9MICO|nr:hypothetical protein [Mycetocola manganoxydans]RLP69023.1 hypothetical protein D9V29_12230 [Mycetocola manganoxydans]GHD52910.1 hypothetical protein GCM10008097_29220 [Mycetocola manganoxydans]